MTEQPLRHLDHTTLRERALESLRSAITSGQYRPGAHLAEAELAGHLGVSRGTVREALRQLQQEGLVIAGARGRLRVHRLSPTEIRELFQVRAALEGLAATLITASKDRAAAVARLRKALSDLDAPMQDVSALIDADLALHLLLCELSGNSVLVDAWRHLEGRLRLTILNDIDKQRSKIMSSTHHAPIVDAIEQGDASLALAALHKHMAVAADRLAGHAADSG
jgi:DNA-binding GntR family transcriptional regulator